MGKQSNTVSSNKPYSMKRQTKLTFDVTMKRKRRHKHTNIRNKRKQNLLYCHEKMRVS